MLCRSQLRSQGPLLLVPRKWDTGNEVVPFWDVNRLFAFILSQVVTLKHWMMQKLSWAYDHLS